MLIVQLSFLVMDTMVSWRQLVIAALLKLPLLVLAVIIEHNL